MLCLSIPNAELTPFSQADVGAFPSFRCEIFQPLCQSVRNGYSLGTPEKRKTGSVVHLSDARQSLYYFCYPISGPGGRRFKSFRPDHFPCLSARIVSLWFQPPPHAQLPDRTPRSCLSPLNGFESPVRLTFALPNEVENCSAIERRGVILLDTKKFSSDRIHAHHKRKECLPVGRTNKQFCSYWSRRCRDLYRVEARVRVARPRSEASPAAKRQANHSSI